MRTTALIYETATGRVTHRIPISDESGIGAPRPGETLLFLDRPTFEEIQAGFPRLRPFDWVLDVVPVVTADYDLAKVTTSGLTVGLSIGHIFCDAGHFEVSEADAFTFDPPTDDIGLAVDIVLNEATGTAELLPNVWDPDTETKADTPAGLTVLQADAVRGVLPAEATSLDELEEE